MRARVPQHADIKVFFGCMSAGWRRVRVGVQRAAEPGEGTPSAHELSNEHLRSLLVVPVQKHRFASTHITQNPEDVTVIADHEGAVVKWNRKLFQAVEELRDLGRSRDQRVLPAIHHEELLSLIVCGEPATQETTVVRFVIEDVFVSPRVVLSMRILGIEEVTVGEDPKHEVWCSVRELLDRLASPSVARCQEWKPLARFLS